MSRGPRTLALVASALVLSAVLMAAATGVVSASLLGGPGSGAGAGAGPGAGVAGLASSAIPAGMLALYREAAATCPGLSWTVLAAIGTVESGNGTSELPGVHSGANAAGAEGPMQFEPATFSSYDEPVPPGGADPPSPYDATDAVFAAARMLCADGAAGGSDVSGAVLVYNHSASYVAEVLALAQQYAGSGTMAGVGAGAGAAGEGQIAADWALTQVGTPYAWGAESPGVGFDCSGLTQSAYREAGIALPRVAQDQFDAGPELGTGAVLLPGDLVFFGNGPESVSHVGLYVGVSDGRAMMVDAPHRGADVRVEPFPTTAAARWGSDRFIGATRPGA